MPQRSRSHELEDESIQAFTSLLPSRWVSRSKERDYGIDREVEIFDDDGRSTGLTFLVQLRATDDPKRASKVRLEADELDYFHQLDLPVAVFRYGSPEKGFFWQWEEMIAARTKLKADQKRFTYNFQDNEQWTGDSAAAIRRTLETRRELRNLPPGVALPLRLDLSGVPVNDRYRIESAVAELLRQCGKAVVRAPQTPQALEIHAQVEAGYLRVRIDSVTSVSFVLADLDANEIAASILYGLALLLGRQRLFWHSRALVRTLIRLDLPHRSQPLAFMVCSTAIGDLSDSVALAILNGLHRQDSEYNAPMAMLLLRSASDAADRETAVKQFYEAGLEAAASWGAEHQAAVHYSLANFYRANQKTGLAVRHYKKALRLRPAYLSTGYFLIEFAGVLYGAGRNRCAAQVYAAAISIEPSARLDFLYADALFRSGRLREARDSYQVAIPNIEGAMRVEAALKVRVCDWLAEIAKADPVPVRRSEAATQITDGSEPFETLWNVVTETDTLNPLAHYNLGILRSLNGHTDKALGDFLSCAFMQPADVEAWANAALCAMQLGESELVLGIVHVAISHAGISAYDKLRANLIEKGLPDEFISSLDSVAMELLNTVETTDEGIVFRMLHDNSFDVVATIGGKSD